MCTKFITHLFYIFHCWAWTCFPAVTIMSAQPEPMKVSTCEITEKDWSQYPDNPDVVGMHSTYGTFHHEGIRIIQNNSALVEQVDFHITVETRYQGVSSNIKISNVNLLEWMPTVPQHLRSKDDYVARLCIYNQLYSRLQVCFQKGEFTVDASTKEGALISRVEIAKNCLGWEKWEIVLFALDVKKQEHRVCYRGWFDFPEDVFREVFEKRNAPLKFKDLQKGTVRWMDQLESNPVPLQYLRTVASEKTIAVQILNDSMYPKSGERSRKEKNIVYPSPAQIKSMRDFLTDNTKFAKFTDIGMYKKSIPQQCSLGRFASVANNQVTVRKTTAAKNSGLEIEIVFSRPNGGEKTKLLVGGFAPSALPVLPDPKANEGWQMPMGIGNHGFWQTYKDLLTQSSLTSGYYALLLDKENRWLDSHTIGIDGPLLYRDAAQPDKKLHLWLLSYERHALVGHYVIEY